MSYADLVTLLLALFTTLYAASSLDAQKAGSLSTSIREAFDTAVDAQPAGEPAPVVAPVTVVPTAPEPREESLQERLQRDLADAIKLDRVEMLRDARGLILSLPEEAAFGVASSEPSGEAREMIRRIAASVGPTASAIRIEGHTDDVPIRTSRFVSNWELSTARASAVVELLVREFGVDPARLSAAGYGEFHPRVPNDSAENRARNRRIDIVILDKDAR
jgi:chemotaxis protein MotB